MAPRAVISMAINCDFTSCGRQIAVFKAANCSETLCDETLLPFFESAGKQKDAEWCVRGSNPPTKPLVMWTKKILITLFVDGQGPLLLIDFLLNGKTVNSVLYQEQLLELLKVAFIANRRGTWRSGRALLHDNAHPHTAMATVAKLKEIGLDVLDHAPYSADMSPCDYRVFGAFKQLMRCRVLGSDLAQVEDGAMRVLRSQEFRSVYGQAINELPKKWAKVIAVKGEFIEGMKEEDCDDCDEI